VSRAPREYAPRATIREMKEGPFEFRNQVLISSHCRLLRSKAVVVSVAETPERCAPHNNARSVVVTGGAAGAALCVQPARTLAQARTAMADRPRCGGEADKGAIAATGAPALRIRSIEGTGRTRHTWMLVESCEEFTRPAQPSATRLPRSGPLRQAYSPRICRNAVHCLINPVRSRDRQHGVPMMFASTKSRIC
jgi:hypothetical protein